MELLEGNYQQLLLMNWTTTPSSASSSTGVAAAAFGGVSLGLRSGLTLHSAAGASLSPPSPAPPLAEPSVTFRGEEGAMKPVNSPLATNPFWHSIKSRPLIKTAIIRYLFVFHLQCSRCTCDGPLMDYGGRGSNKGLPEWLFYRLPPHASPGSRNHSLGVQQSFFWSHQLTGEGR